MNDVTNTVRGGADVQDSVPLTLEQVRDEIRALKALGYRMHRAAWADAIDAHLAKVGVPYAYEYWVINGDGTCSQEIGRHLPSYHYSDRGATKLYIAPPSAEPAQRALMGELERSLLNQIRIITKQRDEARSALAHPRPNSPEIPDSSDVDHPRPTGDGYDVARHNEWLEANASSTVEQAGEVVAFRIVGRHGPYPWVDGKPDPEPEFIVGEGERLELAYSQPRPVGVPDGWKLVPVQLTDAMREQWMEASCTADSEWAALIAAAPAPGKGGEA